MRYDSDPQIVKRILGEVAALQKALERAMSFASLPVGVFDDLSPLALSVLATLDHFIQLHTLNPQFSLSRFSTHYIEKTLSTHVETLSKIFRRKEFSSVEQQVEWNFTRFIAPRQETDSEQTLISLYKKIAQTLETYYADRVRSMHIAAILNEYVGWAEHIQTHGHHDVHGVIIFAEKVARNNAIIDQRVELVKEICQTLAEHAFPSSRPPASDLELTQTAYDLSRMYSIYLLELYQSLLEDMEIIALANKDYRAFEAYCHEHDIDIYEEYRDVLQAHFHDYMEMIDADISACLHLIKTATLIVSAEMTNRRYIDLEVPEEVVGENLSRDIRILERAVRQLRGGFPEIIEPCRRTLQKIRKFKGEIVKPAIEVYGAYMRSPQEFFKHAPQQQTRWIPILDSALACLEPHDEFYQKCRDLKTKIDEQTASEE